MRISHRNISTKEERVANKIGTLLSDLTLDLDKVGYYIYHASPYIIYRRSVEVLQSAEFSEDLQEQARIGYEPDRVW